MSLTFDDVRKILRILDHATTSEIRLENRDLKLVVRKGGIPSIGEAGEAPPASAGLSASALHSPRRARRPCHC